MKKINSIEELKIEASLIEGEYFEFFIMLNFGLRSSKRILFDKGSNTFDVHNEIDDSYQEDLTEKALETDTNIVLAINQGALFKYEF